ncbi:hypothetical protein [Legionella hackeliae]|uniref:HTH cro/C1-type domain-containing protein n=1 Tax=Legionella hackeliae TaxID=449 RepID=A0A0A8UR54_LEGHA|nr:hypothetical protein [Legionella hackeliae]KTD12934.1 hypothetical protein Lhac_1805 [Legionella hackeliae]CEK09244.1 conserved protein of unknown function [Legionella hackeliae]STX49151.1 Uncharacterised protein [Legionella hackeliae]
MPNRRLSERLNKELDVIGVPSLLSERVKACTKIFNLPSVKTEAVLNGIEVDPNAMQTIAQELEVSVDWLLGRKNEKGKNH